MSTETATPTRVGTAQQDVPAAAERTSTTTDGPVRRAAARGSTPRHASTPSTNANRKSLYAALFVLALSVRLFEIKRAYNIFIDETTYAEIARNVSSGQGLTLYGAPFDLHPPLAFGYLGIITRLFGLSNLPTDKLILDLRPSIALFGAATVVIAVFTLRRCGAGATATIAVAIELTFDPFAVFFDSRVMLEAVAQFFVVSSISALVLLTREVAVGPWRRRGLVLVGGIAAGGAFTTKETFGLVLALTLLLLLGLPQLAPRRPVLAVIAIGTSCYVAVMVMVWSTSGFSPWWEAHTSGLARLVGTHQSTGFNASTTKVSLVSRVAANVDQFGVTYLVLGLGGFAVLRHLFRMRVWRGDYATDSDRARTLVAVWGLAAGTYLVYATAFGSIEEQMYYILLAPFVLTLASTVKVHVRSPAPQRVAVGLIMLALAFQCTVWTRVHSTDGNTYERLVTWSEINVNSDTRVAETDDVIQFLLKNVTLGKWTTIDSIEANNADYVVVDSSLVEQGYSAMTPATLTYLERHARVVLKAHSSTDGTLFVFDVRRLSLGSR